MTLTQVRSRAGSVRSRVRAWLRMWRKAPSSPPWWTPEVSILVVSYNGSRHLARMLRSLATTRGVDYELVVVDNASRAAARRVLRRGARKGVIHSLTLLDRNTLFAPGVNTALRVSNPWSRLVLLLNPDVVIRDPDWLRRTLDIHQRGATALGYVGRGAYHRADGYCFLVDRDLLTEVGGLSEDFHWFWAVTRLQADLLARGHSVQAVADHEDVLHHVGGGSGRPPIDAKGMETQRSTVAGWFEGREVTRIERLPARK